MSFHPPPCRLFLITPEITADQAAAFAPLLTAACEAGRVDAVLLRITGDEERPLVKAVKALVPVVHNSGAVALVEGAQEGIDAPTIVIRAGADGVHGALSEARASVERLSVEKRTVGVGGLRTRDEAMEAGEAGVDYLLFGDQDSVVEDVLALVSWWAEIFTVPCVAFSHSMEEIAPLAQSGADFVALSDAVWRHPQGPATAVQEALSLLGSAQANL